MKKTLWNSSWTFTDDAGETQRVTLPHDAMQAAGRMPGAPSGCGGAHYLGGKYVYEKEFSLSEQEAQGTVAFQFDGVYRNARVYINGKEAGGVPYGYLPFFAEGTGLVREGKNHIRVEADNSQQPGSRWYSGGGIYRSVWMWTGEKTHIEPFGIRVTTLRIEPAVIRVETAHTGGSAAVEIWDGEELIAKAEGDNVEITIPNARLWSAETPNLYRCHVTLMENGAVADAADQLFGIRTLGYDTTGFYVNGQRTMLRGGCVHHDNGIIGACSIPEAEERRLRILKSAGFNAIRCAHDPASTDLLEACDKLGMYVMDEMWDMWYQRKTKFDYAIDFPSRWPEDVKAVVDRDYSHPSVILYSIGNEVTEPHEEKGVQLGKDIIELLHRLDPTRPTTVGLNMALVAMCANGVNLFAGVDEPPKDVEYAVNSTMFNEALSKSEHMFTAAVIPEVDRVSSPILDAVDIAGYNYGCNRYPLDATEHPDRVVVGSETMPHHLAATWKTIESLPYVIGDFMWTAWDYIGECSIGTWAYGEEALAFSKVYPWKLADCGAFDLLGDPTGEALWAAAVWNGQTKLGVRPVPYPTKTLARGTWRGTNAIPSWSWQGCEGKMAEVEVFTPGTEAELYLNGKLVERKVTAEMRAFFTVPYAAGKLEAVAYDADGAVIGRDTLTSAGEDLRWQVRCESDSLETGKVAYFTVTLEDAQGNVESDRDAELTLSVTGGRLLGFGSAKVRTTAEFLDGRYPSYYGRALAAVRIEDPENFTIWVCD